MIKYDVYEETVEFSGDYRTYGLTAADIEELYFNQSCICPALVGSFDTLEEAKAAFDKITVRSSHERGTHWHAVCDVAYILKNEYSDPEGDEEPEFDQSLDDCGFKCEPLSPCEVDAYVVGFISKEDYDSMTEAEIAEELVEQADDIDYVPAGDILWRSSIEAEDDGEYRIGTTIRFSCAEDGAMKEYAFKKQ